MVDIRHFIDPSVMAEPKKITEGKLIAYNKGYEKGYSMGVAVGVGVTIGFYLMATLAGRWLG